MVDPPALSVIATNGPPAHRRPGAAGRPASAFDPRRRPGPALAWDDRGRLERGIHRPCYLTFMCHPAYTMSDCQRGSWKNVGADHEKAKEEDGERFSVRGERNEDGGIGPHVRPDHGSRSEGNGDPQERRAVSGDVQSLSDRDPCVRDLVLRHPSVARRSSPRREGLQCQGRSAP
jgi:hypothetical protein